MVGAPARTSSRGRTWTPARSAMFAVALLLMLQVVGCGSGDAAGATRSAFTFDEVPADTLRAHLLERLQSDRAPDGVASHAWEHTRALYEAGGHQPLWVGERGIADRASVLLRHVAEAAEDGLRPGDYPLRELELRLEAIRDASRPSPAEVVDVELRFTALLAAYGEDMLTGRVNPREVDRSWHIDPNEVDIDSALVRVARAERFEEALASLRPQDDDYTALRRELARYREMAQGGGWEEIGHVRVLRAGDSSEAVPVIRARLEAEGFLRSRAGPPSHLYDEEIAGAVYDFQRRYGIAQDSVFGPQTRGAMNVSAESRVRQIEANLERWRWLPHGLGARHLLVNVPDFRVTGFENDEKVLDMRVIVGDEYTATPVFADSMSYLEFYPFWNIPMNIARRSILPHAARDPGYLERNNYEIVRTWAANARPIPVSRLSRSQLQPANFPYRLRQRPGPTNALGLVKFMFPNEFAIYLHDTPAGELFDERVRTFSNGCIRVADPVALAEWVLEPNGGWDGGRIRAAMQGPTRRVDLAEKVPIYIVYLTSHVRDGELFFREDVYGRDSALMDALGPVARVSEAGARAARLAAMLE